MRLHSIAIVVLALAACSQARAPIDRVQPLALDKTFFVGKDLQSPADDPEFWDQSTVIDVSYGATTDGLFTSNASAPVTRIKWVIQEDELVARLTYERIQDSDGKGAGAATNDGQIVAIFKIDSHFDIERSYNPTTGEQLNVVEENTSDRPWYQRQYMRVNWSSNLATSNYELDTLASTQLYGAATFEPVALTITDPRDPNAPHFETENGYFDVTTKVLAKPAMIDLSFFGLGSFPSCFLSADFMGGGGPSANCNDTELTLRHSFRRMVDDDYSPEEWDGFRFQAFGAFTTDRYGYARDYGMTDQLWHRMISRYNIWERSHYYDNPAAMTGDVACYTPDTTPPGADPHRDLNGDGTEDECAAVTGKLASCPMDSTGTYDRTCVGANTPTYGGSQCDTFRQRCTLPYRFRTAKPVAWYYTESSNPEYWDGTRWATRDWDVAMREAVRSARYTECKRSFGQDCDKTFPVFHGQMDDAEDAVALVREVDSCKDGTAYKGQDCNTVADSVGAARGDSAGVIDIAKADAMVVLCHSPLEAGDAPACGQARLPAGVTAASCDAARKARDEDALAVCDKAMNAREGDLRYHHVNVIAGPQSLSPWGIEADASDPLTGEKLAASINVWSYVTDVWSQIQIDEARYIKGELKTADVTEGTNVRDFSEAAEAAAKGSAPKLNAAQVKEWSSALQPPGIVPPALDPRLTAKVKAMIDDMRHEVRADASVPSVNDATYDARRKQAIGTTFEAQLMTPAMQALAGNANLPSDVLAQLASPLRGANPTVMKELKNLRDIALADRGSCIMNQHDTPLAIAPLADVLQQKFGNFSAADPIQKQLDRADKMRKFIAQRGQYAVIVHEMGHSIGLRHNFVSSADAYNYRPQYWQLRTEDGADTTPCTTYDPSGTCVGPRYFDPVTDNEKNNLIPMFMQSSVMDYAGESTQDLMGLGAYDFAAARMFYGDVASVYTDLSYADGTQRSVGALDKLDNFGGLFGFQPKLGTTDIHYSQLQNAYDLISDCHEVNPQAYKPAGWDKDRWGEWSPLLDGAIVSVNGKYTRCKQQGVDYVSWNQLGGSQVGAGNGRSPMQVDAAHRTRVPYGFATDTWADVGNLSVYRHDNGADPYELFDFFITQQEVNHIFDNYRRGRTNFSVRSAEERTLSRYNEKLKEAAKGVAFAGNFIRTEMTNGGEDADNNWPPYAAAFLKDNLIAAEMGFDHFTRLLDRPQDGDHVLPLNGAQTPAPDGVMRSLSDSFGYVYNTDDPSAILTIPNGATGLYGSVTFGGRPVENALASTQGEYDVDYTINAGSYYDKIHAAYLMTESEDHFISSSRSDFVDPRYRAYSMADLFPDGFRRWLGNNLTGDDALKGPRVASNLGVPLKTPDGFPLKGLGYVSWWRTDPVACFSAANNLDCATAPDQSMVIDPEVGFEQQKFLIAYTLLYLPVNQQRVWLDQIDLWEKGADSDPGIDQRIEFHDPGGLVYVARTFGKETVLGKTVEKGISARVLEYANQLMARAYETDPGPDNDGDGQPDWVLPKHNPDGSLIVRFDPTVDFVPDKCSRFDDSGCICTSNRACVTLSHYTEVPSFIRAGLAAYHLGEPSMRGLYQ